MLFRQIEKRLGRSVRRAFVSMVEQTPWEVETYADIERVLDQIRDWRSLSDALERGLIDASDLGTTVAFDQLAGVGMAFDWTLVNTQAREWARQYTGQLITQIDETTRRSVREAVTRWIDNGEPLDALVGDLRAGPFSERRARMIASTEVTRAFASANEIAYQQSGVVKEVEWRAAMDERVCPVCGGLNGKRVPLGQRFEGGAFPPAHPGCRCWVAPVVD